MFSAEQLKKFAPKQHISQATFDEAVRENIEEFEMEADEAVASAIAEFKAQGVDLSDIVTSATGSGVAEHPAGQAAKALEAHLKAGDLQAAQAALAALRCAVEGGSDLRELGAIVHSLGATDLAVQCVTLTRSEPENRETLLAAVCTLRALLPLSPSVRAAFRDAGGPAALASVVVDSNADPSRDWEVTAASLHAAAALAVKDEAGKGAAMDAALGTAALTALSALPGSDDPAVVVAACALLSSLTTADDETQPGSRAFPNARALAQQGAAKVLVSAMTAHPAVHRREAFLAACDCLRRVAANDEICQEAAAAGAVSLALQVAGGALHADDAIMARTALSLLRQLASSDAVKGQLASLEGGIEGIKTALAFAADNISAIVAEPALGLLANLALRNPEVAVAAVKAGCCDEGLRVMQALMDAAAAEEDKPAAITATASGGRTPSALRQGCMALRNIAARCPEEREGLLTAGAERVVRQARAAFPEACQDVASAALRDFGIDKYNE